jgi:hypothetical protein
MYIKWSGKKTTAMIPVFHCDETKPVISFDALKFDGMFDSDKVKQTHLLSLGVWIIASFISLVLSNAECFLLHSLVIQTTLGSVVNNY